MSHPLPQRRHYLAVFFASLSLLMLEITVARMLTVALFSHYAFVAISLAMFGLGLSGLVVYLLPRHFPAERVDEQVTTFLSLFGLTAALSVLAFLHIHVVQSLSLAGLSSLGLAYVVLTVPFFLGGICISLLMTHFSSSIASIYYADLVGASLGCLGVVTALGLLPAPQVAVVIAAVASVTALFIAFGSAHRQALAATSAAVVGVLLVLSFTNDLYEMRYIKQRTDTYSEKTTWNSFSRVSAFAEDRNAAQILPMRSPYQSYQDGPYPPTKMLDIDGAAWTPMMGWNGDPASIQWLRDSVLYVAHEIRPHAKVLVIGTGGGRDLLAAVAYGQPSITGLEINQSMRHTVEDLYADYAGHPYTHPGVHVIIDEARSRLSGLDDKFDILQLSLIDTFSLNAAGGFVFSENYLYTTEGFQEYYDHLTDNGILSVTRYMVAQYPVEVLRIVAMARAAWEGRGVQDFASHIVVLKQDLNTTMLVNKSPFTKEELAKLKERAGYLNAQIMWMPGEQPGHLEVARVISSPDWRTFMSHYQFFIDPPTDDRPFFFNFLRGLLPTGMDDPFHFLTMWNDALALMYMLMGTVTVLAVLFFSIPLLLFRRGPAHRVPAGVAAPLLLYFACLGYGFLMIEIPLLQKLMLLLGAPVYALAVVLFALLFFSGNGSLLSERLAGDNVLGTLTRVLTGILVISSVYIVALPSVIHFLLGDPIAVRILVTVLLLAPIGLLLGMAYPLGITLLRTCGEELVPWAWGLNGAMSVVASVVAIFIGSKIGFTAAFLTGVLAYAVALGSMTLAMRMRGPASLPS
ncbi:MAG TPA: class I SAM-dependent methyltransferase [Candidatus Binatia bacterium]|jgi:spermidine synthase